MNADSQIPLEYDSLIDVFERAMAREDVGSVVCLRVVRSDLSEAMTFAELGVRARVFAGHLTGRYGIGRGDKVAIIGKNRCDWDVVLWGSILVGAIPVLIDPERPPQAVLSHLTHTDTRLATIAEDYRDGESRAALVAAALAEGIAVLEMNGAVGLGDPVERPDKGGPGFEAASGAAGLDETAVILCTSGTTGDPREVELTGRNLIANIQGCLGSVDINHRDRLVHILPPHHSFGLTVGKLLPLWVGATNIYTNKYRHVGDILAEHRATIFISIPALFTVLAKKLEDAIEQKKQHGRFVAFLDRWAPAVLGRMLKKKQGWGTLRFFLSGAAPVPHWVLEVFWRRGLPLYQGYGTTENSPVYGFCDRRRKLGSVGRPIPTLSVRIADDAGGTLGAGERGEILLGGPCIMKGYYKNPASTQAAVFADEQGVRWLRTGDLGYLDREGYLYITGRKKYIIVLPSGKNVNPELIEIALSEARFVDEVLVLPGCRESVPGVREETVRAIICPDWEALAGHTRSSRQELLTRPQLVRNLIWESVHECQQNSVRLSPFERVASKQDIEIAVDGFEKTATGKIKREVYLNGIAQG